MIRKENYLEVPEREIPINIIQYEEDDILLLQNCLLYTSDAADEEDSVDLGGLRDIKKKKKHNIKKKNKFRT